MFHRPLILALIRWAGPKAAATQGLPLTWKVQGSLWNDLTLESVKTGGGEKHWLPRATLGRLAVDYDVPAYWQTGLEKVVKGVTLHDLDAEVDLRHLPPPAAVAEVVEEKSAAAGKAPPLVWPRYLDLKNLNATVTLADGRRLALRGLDLQIGEGQPGRFACKELRVEPEGPNLEQISAQIEWSPRKIVIRNFALPKDVVLDELTLDLADFEAGNITARILAHLGAARFATDAQVKNVFVRPLEIQAKVEGTGLRAEELHTLGLPKEVTFDQGGLRLEVGGDPLRPPALRVQGAFSVANIRAAGSLVDKVELEFGVENSAARLTTARITRGGNTINATASAQLPAELSEWKKIAWSAELNASLAEAAQFLAKPPPVKGNLQFKSTARGTGPTPTSVEGEISGKELAFETYRLPALRTTFALNGREARVEMPPLGLGAGNQMSFKAALQMDDAMPVQAEWKLAVTDPAALFQTTGLPPPPKSLSGRLETEGNARLVLKELGEGDYSRLVAGLKLKLEQAKFGDSPLPQITVDARVQDGQAHLEPCFIRINDSNHIRLTAKAGLKAPFDFFTQGDVQMPELTSLNALLASFGAPPIKAGALYSKLDATGQGKPWTCGGQATLTAAKVRTAQMPEAADVTLDATFKDKDAELARLEAVLGLWKVSLKGRVNDRQADLTQLQVWQKNTLLLDGRAAAPFDIMKPGVAAGAPLNVAFTAKDLRVSEVLAAAGIKDIPPGVLNADIQVKGRLEDLAAAIQVNLKDVKAPNAPKAFGPAALDVSVALNGKNAKAQIKLNQPPLQPLTVDAGLPVDVAALVKDPSVLNSLPLNVALRLPESDLGFVREYAPEMIRALPARLKLDAAVKGSVGKPVITAALDVAVPEIGWAQPDLPSVRDVRVRIRADDRRVNFEDVSVMLAGGRVKLGGDVDLKDPKQPAFNLSLQAREALVFRDPTTSLRANADITCQGNLARARVAGLVEAVRGRVFKEIDLMPVLKLPADVPPVPADTRRSEAKLALPPVVKDWIFDIKVRTKDPLLVSGNLANGAISADVLLSGTGAAPRLTGGANIDRLLLKLPFSLVKITKGVVTLNPAKPFDPGLDIRGESRVGSNDITLYIYGDSTNPKTRFTSTPPMSEPDIVTLLATGTTLGGSPDQLASEAASRAAFLFLSEFYRKTFNKKKVVKEEPPRLHMTFNPSGADRSNDSVQAAYDLTDNWRITGRFTQTGRMKALLGYVLRFGKAAQAVDNP